MRRPSANNDPPLPPLRADGRGRMDCAVGGYELEGELSDVKIEKGIPIPLRGQYSKYPFGQMKIGDSFLIEEKHVASKVSQAAAQFARRAKKPLKFAVRHTPDGHRCWRIA